MVNGSNAYSHREEGYKVLVPAAFIIKSVLASFVLAFCIGRAARQVLCPSQDASLQRTFIPLTENQGKNHQLT
jgi:hypothetical protein